MGNAALFSNVSANDNTAVGLLALANNDSSALGGANDNTAVGALALFNNVDGFGNIAVGSGALSSNVAGAFNVAMGDAALNNADSAFNTAVGFNAGQATTTGVDNIYLGDTAGTLDLSGAPVPAGENSTLRIGSLFTNSQCFIGGIATFPQVWNGVTVCQVTVNGFGQLGVDCVNPNNPGTAPQGYSAPVPHSAPQPRSAPPLVPNRPQRQAMVNDRVEKLQATVAQQQKQIETLTAQLKEQAVQFTTQLKEQAAQIQKVSAQIEMGQPATKVVVQQAVKLFRHRYYLWPGSRSRPQNRPSSDSVGERFCQSVEHDAFHLPFPDSRAASTSKLKSEEDFEEFDALPFSRVVGINEVLSTHVP